MATVTVRELAREWHVPEDAILGAIKEIDEFHRDQDRRDMECGFGDSRPRPSCIANQNEIEAWREAQRGGDAVGPEPEPRVVVENLALLKKCVMAEDRWPAGPRGPANEDLYEPGDPGPAGL